MSSLTTLSADYGKPELPSWVSTYAQELRINAEGRSELWPQDPLVSALFSFADEIEARALAHALEELTLHEAAEESGYTRNHLNRLLREQAIPTSGEGEPRILRSHLPKKPGQGVAPPVHSGPITRTQVARAIAEGDEI
jgi:hypothetical protein